MQEDKPADNIHIVGGVDGQESLAMSSRGVPILHCHLAMWSDISPTVSWLRRMCSTTSHIAMALLCALAIRTRVEHASPLVPKPIAGTQNLMADFLSRKFFASPHEFLTAFDTLLHGGHHTPSMVRTF